MATPTITKAISTSTNPGSFGLLNSRVVPGVRDAGSTVVGAVERLISGLVDMCGRTLVSISLGTGAEPNFTVPASAMTGPESLIKAVPSARQNTSASSVSTRLHWGHRFMFEVLRLVAASSLVIGQASWSVSTTLLTQSKAATSLHSNLLRQADAAQEIGKVRIGAEAVHMRVGIKVKCQKA